MVRIRKKTSKRVQTHQREKIKHKVSESRKKGKKELKKNTQWKSKHKKDPGIPNNFPYKDQILAEIAEERRKAAEEKQARKERKKLEKEEGKDEKNAEGFDGIGSLSNGTLNQQTASKGKQKAPAEDNEEDIPILINREYDSMSAALDKADVVLEVLDSRDPLACQSNNLVDFVSEKKQGKIMTVLSKIDLSPREAVQAWAAQLRRQHPTFLFRSASAFITSSEPGQSSNSQSKDDGFGADGLLDALEAEAKGASKESFNVAVVGVANSGKSSLINSLLHKLASPIYKLSSTISGPSTTERPLEIQLERNGIRFNFIDTPAYSWIKSDEENVHAEEIRAKDVLVRNRGRIDKTKDPVSIVKGLVQRSNAEDLMLFYNLPAFNKSDDTAFLGALAKANKLVKKAGELDIVQAARIVLRDWSTDKFPRYTMPSPTASSSAPPRVAENDQSMYVSDSATLEAAPTRKELRKGRGLIKLTPLSVETRRLALEVKWDEAEEDETDEDGKLVAAVTKGDEDDEEEEEEEEEDEDIEEEIDDIDEDEEDEDTEEEDLPPPSQNQRKRKGNLPPTPARKKVAFDVKEKEQRSSKQKPSGSKSKRHASKKGRK